MVSEPSILENTMVAVQPMTMTEMLARCLEKLEVLSEIKKDLTTMAATVKEATTQPASCLNPITSATSPCLLPTTTPLLASEFVAPLSTSLIDASVGNEEVAAWHALGSATASQATPVVDTNTVVREVAAVSPTMDVIITARTLTMVPGNRPYIAPIGINDFHFRTPATCFTECPSCDIAAPTSVLTTAATPTSSVIITDPSIELAATMGLDINHDAVITNYLPSTPTNCLTLGPDLNAAGVQAMELSTLMGDVLPTTLDPSEVPIGCLSRLFMVYVLQVLTPTRCSLTCYDDNINDLMLLYTLGVTQCIRQSGLVLQPLPWPSFIDEHTNLPPWIPPADWSLQWSHVKLLFGENNERMSAVESWKNHIHWASGFECMPSFTPRNGSVMWLNSRSTELDILQGGLDMGMLKSSHSGIGGVECRNSEGLIPLRFLELTAWQPPLIITSVMIYYSLQTHMLVCAAMLYPGSKFQHDKGIHYNGTTNKGVYIVVVQLNEIQHWSSSSGMRMLCHWKTVNMEVTALDQEVILCLVSVLGTHQYPYHYLVAGESIWSLAICLSGNSELQNLIINVVKQHTRFYRIPDSISMVKHVGLHSGWQLFTMGTTIRCMASIAYFQHYGEPLKYSSIHIRCSGHLWCAEIERSKSCWEWRGVLLLHSLVTHTIVWESIHMYRNSSRYESWKEAAAIFAHELFKISVQVMSIVKGCVQRLNIKLQSDYYMMDIKLPCMQATFQGGRHYSHLWCSISSECLKNVLHGACGRWARQMIVDLGCISGQIYVSKYSSWMAWDPGELLCELMTPHTLVDMPKSSSRFTSLNKEGNTMEYESFWTGEKLVNDDFVHYAEVQQTVKNPCELIFRLGQGQCLVAYRLTDQQFLWDPGALHLTSCDRRSRLEVKPIFKEGGMSGAIFAWAGAACFLLSLVSKLVIAIFWRD